MASASSLLAHAAARAAQRPGFVASVLARYQAIEQLDAERLAVLLGCSMEDYHRLALCRVPERPSADDLQELAGFVRADAGALARIVRRVAAVDALAARTGAPSALLAARERSGGDEQE